MKCFPGNKHQNKLCLSLWSNKHVEYISCCIKHLQSQFVDLFIFIVLAPIHNILQISAIGKNVHCVTHMLVRVHKFHFFVKLK